MLSMLLHVLTAAGDTVQKVGNSGLAEIIQAMGTVFGVSYFVRRDRRRTAAGDGFTDKDRDRAQRTCTNVISLCKNHDITPVDSS